MMHLLEHQSLYVVALKKDANDCPWIVLKDEDEKLKDVFAFLKKYDRVYKDGIELKPIQSTVWVSYGCLESFEKERKTIKLGRAELKAAILGLQRFNGIGNKEMAHYLIVSIESISETLRFKFVLDFIIKHFEKGEAPGKIIENIEDKWSKMSSFI